MQNVTITPQQLGQVLKAQRKAKGLTQMEAGQTVGLLPKSISKLELDPATASIESLFKLLSALGLELVVSEIPQKQQKQDW
jgi:HTH-type transcriptional regulator/antitoxin HipB